MTDSGTRTELQAVGFVAPHDQPGAWPSRLLTCTRCHQRIRLYDHPAGYVTVHDFVCADCLEQAGLERLAEAEAAVRRASLFQVPALPFNQRRA